MQHMNVTTDYLCIVFVNVVNKKKLINVWRLVAWHSGNTFHQTDEVTLCQARL